jgi:hypothetical protein
VSSESVQGKRIVSTIRKQQLRLIYQRRVVVVVST